MTHNIPKIIHQIWVGPHLIPNNLQTCIDSVKNHFSDFEYMFWHNGNIPKMPTNVEEQFNKYEKLGIPAFQADILRLFILNTYGGIFLDADFFVKQNFWHTINKPFWCVIANEKTRRHVFNGIFACESNNPILNQIIIDMKDEPLKGNGLQGHGPLLFSKYIRQFVHMPADSNIYQYLLKSPHPYVQCDSHVNFQNGKYTKHLFFGSSKQYASWKTQL